MTGFRFIFLFGSRLIGPGDWATQHLVGGILFQVLGTFAKDLAEAMRTLHAAGAVVRSDSSAAPRATLRELVRQKSDGGDDEESAKAAAQERNDIWRKAVLQRKKFAAFSCVTNVTEASLKDAEKKCAQMLKAAAGGAGDRANVVAQPGDKSDLRLYVMSGDLLTQRGKKPWQAAGDPEEKVLAEMLKFLAAQKGQATAILAFDGCIRKVRRGIDSSIAALANARELCVIYKSSWNGWVKRRHHMQSENIELGAVRMAVARNKTTIKARATFCGAGEDSTHFTTYTGVSLPPRVSLPRISVDDKLKIFADETAELPSKWAVNVPAGVPLFWGETKSKEFWKQILGDIGAKTVVDLTPSTAMAEACVELGIPLSGIVASATHLTWLVNTVDRAALRFICKSGSFLFQEELASHIHELFADLVDTADDTLNDDQIMESDVEEDDD